MWLVFFFFKLARVFIQSHWRRNGVLDKTFRRKWCILTVLLRAIIDILCIYSANLHPNREKVGFVSVNTQVFAKLNKGKCFPQKQEEITLHGFVCTSAGNYRQHDHTISGNCTFLVTD